MKKPLNSQLTTLADRLFDRPLTPIYWLWIVFCLVIGFVLVQPTNRMSDLVKHLIMGAVMVGLAPLFNFSAGRWAWAGFMLLLLVLLVLDVAISVLS